MFHVKHIFQDRNFALEQTTGSDNQVVVDLLTTLRNEKFSPIGWWRFFRSLLANVMYYRERPSLTQTLMGPYNRFHWHNHTTHGHC